MNFGFSTSDIATVLIYARRAYQTYLLSPSAFEQLWEQFRSFIHVIAKAEEAARTSSLSDEDKARLSEINHNSTTLLEDLRSFIEKHGALREPDHGAWERLQWSQEAADRLSHRILCQTQILHTFYALTFIEKNLSLRGSHRHLSTNVSADGPSTESRGEPTSPGGSPSRATSPTRAYSVHRCDTVTATKYSGTSMSSVSLPDCLAKESESQDRIQIRDFRQ